MDLRYLLLETATDYGLARAFRTGDLTPDWRAWIGYRRAIDVWTASCRSEEEREQRLQEVRRVEPDDGRRVAREASGADWNERLVGLAEAGRAEDDANVPIFHEFRKEGAHAPGLWLLGAIEDSLVLDLYGHDGGGALCAGADEVLQLLLAARSDGVWAYTEHEPRPAMPDKPGELPTPDASEARALLDECLACRDAGAELYRELDPQGRELTNVERGRVHGQLGSAASIMRRVAHRRTALNDLFAEAMPEIVRTQAVDPADVNVDRTMEINLRRLQRGFVLMISDSQLLRERVLPASRLNDDGVLTSPVL